MMTFGWDPAKASANITKHGMSFLFASQVWNDPSHLVLADRVENGEQRWHAVGLVGTHVVALVVHSYPEPDDGDRVRIIGARRATRLERKRYEQNDA